ncbi:MAG: hypothetical protein ABIE25_05350 [Thermoplasmatota archaeon]
MQQGSAIPQKPGRRPYIKVVAAIIIVVTLIMVTVGVLIITSQPKAELKILTWSHRGSYYGEQFTVIVSNNGSAVGNVTIKCEVQTDVGIYYGTQVTFLSPGEVRTYTIYVVYHGSQIIKADCWLVTF